ncbi:MAG: acyl-CoA dehydrogenase family protein [Deltaproteobacteria bacterium]|nr:acyl-CoA dehydrogenase family protein [Deltaproteobacteria bacterium]MBW2416401.1 acyl-CoA dehydrogenase family protein [Deltaproteobacteria bacterium]
MEFELNEEQQILREEVRKFLEAEIRPLDDEWGDVEMTADRAREFCKKLIPWGYMGGGVAELGVERDATVGCILNEELARVFPALGGVSGMTSGTAAGISMGGHPEVAARLVEPLRQSDLIGCNAFTEPNAGSDPSGIECRAEKKGDRWIVNGAKAWISNGHIADVAIVLVQTDPSKGAAGFRQLVIDRRESPFESRDTPTIGLRAFPTSELWFNDVEVPEINTIGGWKQGAGGVDPATAFARTLAAIAGVRAGTALMSVGIAQRAFDLALDYVKQRRQFGKEIARHQMVSAMIADMATDIDASRLLCYRALHKRGRPEVEASMAKAFATEAAVRVCSTAMQCMGANGLATENRVERCLRDARMLTIPDGTTQIQKLIVGRALTGMSAIR